MCVYVGGGGELGERDMRDRLTGQRSRVKGGTEAEEKAETVGGAAGRCRGRGDGVGGNSEEE